VNSRVDGPVKKRLNSIIILVAWSLWNHCNRCVYDGVQPNLNEVLLSIREELHLWGLAGARGVTSSLSYQLVRIVGPGLGSGKMC